MKKFDNISYNDIIDILRHNDIVLKDKNGDIIDVFPSNQLAESTGSDEDIPIAEPVPMPELPGPRFENDKYIDPAIMELRDLEADFPPMFKTALDMSRVNNAGIVNRMAEEMSDLYKTHLSTLLEYNTQYTAQCVMSLRDELMYYLESLVKKK